MKYILIFLMVLRYCGLYAQDSKVDVSRLQVPSSPGFQVLDISPASIERPTSPKQFAISILNATNSGSTLPKNFAIEMAPYWFIKHGNEDPLKYLNVNNTNSFSGIARKFSISLSSVYSDSSAGSLLKNTNYISSGARTTLYTFRLKKSSEKIKSGLVDLASRMGAIGKGTTGGINQAVKDPDKIEESLNTDSAYQKALLDVLSPPLVQLDIAGAYSEAFANSDYSSQRFNRAEGWATLTLSAPNMNWGNLNILGIYRLLNDNVLTDTAKNIFTKETAYDVGARINYSFKNLSLSYEYLKRHYNDNTNLNSNRSVFILQYKVSSTLYVTGTYGKNFGEIKNLFALLGLNFGFGSSSITVLNDKK